MFFFRQICIFFLGFVIYIPLFSQSIKPSLTEIDGDFVAGEVIIQLKSAGHLRSSRRTLDTVLDERYSLKSQLPNDTVLVALDDSVTVEQALAEFSRDPAVLHVQPNYQYSLSTIDTNDVHRWLLWWLDSLDDQDIDAPEAWEISEGSGIIVAVIDTGVAYNHPDLLWNMWDGTNCVDENGATLGGCLHGYDYEDNDKNPLPTSHTHGTHVAGTIAALKNNTHGIIWVAPQAQIMALKSGLTTVDIVKNIAFAEQNGAKIINASWWGTAFDPILYDAIAWFSGLFVSAAGNSGSDNDTTLHHYPADYTLPNIITVAATNDSDSLAGFSSYGNISVDLGAPWQAIYSTLVSSSTVYSENFSSSLIPAFPLDFVSTGNWQSFSSPSHWSIVAQGDTQSPYSDNASDTLTSPTIDLLWLSGSIAFFAECDTKYITTGWEDYMSLEYSSDGVTFTEAVDPFFPGYPFWWDEAYLDTNGSSSGSTNFYFNGIGIPSQYMTEDFRFRFRWTTDGTDNNYAGCFIDDISISSFSDGSLEEYGYLSGTSMAAPHVAGAAALLWSYDPDLTVAEVKDALMNSGDSLISLNGKTVSGKRLNILSALNSLSSAKSLSTFDIPGSLFTIISSSLNTVTIYVPEADFPLLTPTMNFIGASISPASGVEQNFTNPVIYTVTGADSSTRQYTVTVYPVEDDKSDLTALLDAEIGVDHDNPVYSRIEAQYTPDSWSDYVLFISLALNLEDDDLATVGDVLDMISGLTLFIESLDFTNQEALDILLSEASVLTETDYSPLSWDTLEVALALPETTYAQIATKIITVEDAIDNLEFASQAALDSLIVTINALIEAEYDSISWMIFESQKNVIIALSDDSELSVAYKRESLQNLLTHLQKIVPVSAVSPLVPITEPSYVQIDTWTTNPQLDLSGLQTGSTALLPEITILTPGIANISIFMPSNTTLTSSDTHWDGIFDLPTTTSVTLPLSSWVTKTLWIALQLWDAGSTLTFDRAIMIVFPSEAGKRIGYFSGSTFVEITNTCSANSQTMADLLPAAGDCKIEDSWSLIVWTKHMTTFATYSQTVTSSGGGGGGWWWWGGGGWAGFFATPVKAPTKQWLTDFLHPDSARDIAKLKPSAPASRLSAVTLWLALSNTTLADVYVCRGWYVDIGLTPSYACQVIEEAAKKQLITRANTLFRPSDTLSRAEAYAILMKSICIVPDGSSPDWQTNIARKAREHGFTVRDSETFEPERPLLVSEMYAIVSQMVKYREKEGHTCTIPTM
jgi:subtilisin family serine protease